MVEVALWYGRETLRARFPDRSFVIDARQPGEGARTQTREERMEAVRRALQNPLERPRLRKMVAPGASVVIAFDDPTVRGSGDIRELIIEACLEELAEAGVDERNVRLICANALHRKFTRDELAHVIGSSLAERFADRLVCHDAEDWENLVSFGQTPDGHWVDLNRAAVEADLLVYVNAGCVLGFSGGWKSIVVGLSTWRSIKSTHHPDGMSMSIAHNRMHAVFEEMAELLPESLRSRIFKVETVMDGPEAVAGVWAGSIPAARAAALAFLAARNPPRRAAAPARVDVVAYG
ncbi:MAG: nickel-dependent lactate racemase, partial [Dehalococcoidia bacterium]|nr:nickel-dependent lactate racemase [Dehalococcoidia bacterium]